jgi:hypothetical protein
MRIHFICVSVLEAVSLADTCNPRENESGAIGHATSNRRWDLCQGFQSVVALSKPPGHHLWNCLSSGQATGSALHGIFPFEDMAMESEIFRKFRKKYHCKNKNE